MRCERIEYRRQTDPSKLITEAQFLALPITDKVIVTYVNVLDAIVALGRVVAHGEFTVNVVQRILTVMHKGVMYKVRFLRGSGILFSGHKNQDFLNPLIRANPETAHVDWMYRSKQVTDSKIATSSKDLDPVRYIVKVARRSHKGIVRLIVVQDSASYYGRMKKLDSSFDMQAELSKKSADRVVRYAAAKVKDIITSVVEVPAQTWSVINTERHMQEAFERSRGSPMHDLYDNTMELLNTLSKATSTKKATECLKGWPADSRIVNLSIMLVTHFNVTLSDQCLDTYLAHRPIADAVQQMLKKAKTAKLILAMRTRIQAERAAAAKRASLCASAQDLQGATTELCKTNPYTITQLANHLAAALGTNIAASLVRMPLRGLGINLGKLADEKIDFDKYDTPSITTLTDAISREAMPVLKDLWPKPVSPEARCKALLYATFLIVNVKEPGMRRWIIQKPLHASLLHLPYNSRDFIEYANKLLCDGRLVLRSDRFQVTAHGKVDGEKMAGLPYFLHVWESTCASAKSADLLNASSFEMLLAAIGGTWSLRGRWAVSRELRLVFPNVKYDGCVKLDHNEAGAKLRTRLGVPKTLADPFLRMLLYEAFAIARQQLQTVGLQADEVARLSRLSTGVSDCDGENLICEMKELRWIMRLLMRNYDSGGMQLGWTLREDSDAAHSWANAQHSFDHLTKNKGGEYRTSPLCLSLDGCQTAIDRHIAAFRSLASTTIDHVKAIPADIASALMKDPNSKLPKMVDEKKAKPANATKRRAAAASTSSPGAKKPKCSQVRTSGHPPKQPTAASDAPTPKRSKASHTPDSQ